MLPQGSEHTSVTNIVTTWWRCQLSQVTAWPSGFMRLCCWCLKEGTSDGLVLSLWVWKSSQVDWKIETLETVSCLSRILHQTLWSSGLGGTAGIILWWYGICQHLAQHKGDLLVTFKGGDYTQRGLWTTEYLSQLEVLITPFVPVQVWWQIFFRWRVSTMAGTRQTRGERGMKLLHRLRETFTWQNIWCIKSVNVVFWNTLCVLT